MSSNHGMPEHHTILEDAWSHVVGGMDWLRSVFFGEFADNRPISAVIADMLVSFVPGVVIVTSARDAVAVILRLANHPEKREDLMEWVLLCACMIVIALPVVMAAAGVAAMGVGAVVGGIAGTELGAALRAVMLMLIKEASKLVELVRFLQKFIKGDILNFLRAVKFAKYEKALLQALSQISGKLLQIVTALRTHLEGLKYFDMVSTTVAKLAEWEKKFYNVQQDALKQIPKALAELDARLAKVLAETAPKEVHTVVSGVRTDKAIAALPAKQRVRDTPGKILVKADSKATNPRATTKTKLTTSKKPESKAAPDIPLKDKPDVVYLPEEGANTKIQEVADVAIAVDRDRITQLSNEAREATKRGDNILAEAKIKEARDILRPHLPKKPGDSWDQVIARLDVSSPKDGAVFWSGDPKAAQKFAESINGVALETTSGGRVIDGWDDVNKGYTWDARYGTGPYGRDLWAGASRKYAEGVTGKINTVQTSEKLWNTETLWHNVEKPEIQDKLMTGEVSGVDMCTVNSAGKFMPLSENYVKSLMRLKGTLP